MPNRNVWSTGAGISIIELTLVMGLLVTLAAASVPLVTNLIVRTDQDTMLLQIVSMFKKSQEYAMDKKRGLVWGVCVTGGKVRLYGGSCASPQQPEEWMIPTTVTVAGFSDITFGVDGKPSAPVSGTVTSQFKSQTFQINAIGGIDVVP